MIIDKNTLINGFAGAAMAIGLSVSSALADDPQIIIRYGENVAGNAERWARVIEKKGVRVELQSGLDNPNCAAVIHNGEEKFRYSSQTLQKRPTLSTVSIRLANNKRTTSPRLKSTCSTTVAALNPT